jgi:hypothetical protein
LTIAPPPEGLLKTFSSEAARSANHEAYAVRVR